MGYYAKIENGKVVQVIVCGLKGIGKYSGTWIETKMDNSLRKQYAGIGMSYDSTKDKFIRKSPYPSWNLDVNDDWQPPTPRPKDIQVDWDEITKSWKQTDK